MIIIINTPPVENCRYPYTCASHSYDHFSELALRLEGAGPGGPN